MLDPRKAAHATIITLLKNEDSEIIEIIQSTHISSYRHLCKRSIKGKYVFNFQETETSYSRIPNIESIKTSDT